MTKAAPVIMHAVVDRDNKVVNDSFGRVDDASHCARIAGWLNEDPQYTRGPYRAIPLVEASRP